MNTLLQVTTNGLGQEVVDSRLIAEALGVEHDNFLETINTYKVFIESKFGIVPFETEKINGRGRPKRFCFLNEDQALFIATLSRNTERVVEFKAMLVMAFQEARRNKQTVALTQLDILAQSVQILQQQQRDITELKETVRQIDARTQTRPDYFTIVGYASLNGMNVGLKTASSAGQRASRICKERGIQTESCPDPRFGTVNMYPSQVLKEVFAMPIV